MENEIWKDIPGFEGIYMVSNIGNVKSVRYSKHKLLKYFKSNGYNKVDFKLKVLRLDILYID